MEYRSQQHRIDQGFQIRVFRKHRQFQLQEHAVCAGERAVHHYARYNHDGERAYGKPDITVAGSHTVHRHHVDRTGDRNQMQPEILVIPEIGRIGFSKNHLGYDARNTGAEQGNEIVDSEQCPVFAGHHEHAANTPEIAHMKRDFRHHHVFSGGVADIQKPYVEAEFHQKAEKGYCKAQVGLTFPVPYTVPVVPDKNHNECKYDNRKEMHGTVGNE